ncbi:MAG: STAS domain-containing protein [Candidatus Peregrinibacteria bacterium]|nr:STAS domain-containing protein [Candidatus Peregrinibacteria bacterium]
MSEIQITFQDETAGAKAIKIVSFVGQLDETNVDHEAKKIYQVITEMPEPDLILDFAGLEYMNSKSIGYVTDWYTQAQAKGGIVAIVGPKPNILDILKVVGITQIITVYNSMDEAKTAMSGVAAPAAASPVAPATPVTPAPATPEVPVPAAPAAETPPATPSA